MGTDVQSTDFSNKVLSDINGTADKAYQEMLLKKAKYEAAKNQLSVFQQFKNAALSKFNAAKSNAQDENDSTLLSAKAEYASALGQYSDADMDTDILRSSLMDSIFYSGRMNNSAFIANAQIA